MTHFDLSHGSIADSYALENLLFSSRTADAYRGVDLGRNVAVTIWLSRGAFVRHSNRTARFIERLAALEQIAPSIVDIISFGTDRAGVGFVVLPIIDGTPAATMLREAAEIERRFILMLKTIELVHSAELICGDISKYSFWLNRSGELSFIGAFGPDAGEVGDRSQTIAADISGFCPPELFRGEGITRQSDVYSLGALCYYFLTGNTPPAMGLKSPLEFNIASVVTGGVLPVWAEEVLRNSLATDPSQRYETASEMLRALLAVKERSFHVTSMPIHASQAMLPERTQQKMLVRSKPKQADLLSEGDGAEQEAPPRTRWAWIAGTLCILLSSGIVAKQFGYFSPVEEEVVEEEPQKPIDQPILHEGIETDRPLKAVLSEVERNAAGVIEDKEKLRGLIVSDDPVAHDTLVRLALQARTIQGRQRVEESIIERARRLGSIRSAEEVRNWLLTFTDQVPECYEQVLRAVDLTLPQDAIERYLRQAYTKAPAVVLRLTAALGFDSKNVNKFHTLLAQLIGDSLKLEDSKDHSAAALILADPISSEAYADDVIQTINEIPDNDIQWLLDILALRRDPNIKVIAHTAIDRNLLPPGKKIFALLLRDRDDISAPLAVSLVNAVAGTTSDADIAQIGSWYDVQSEFALFGIMATTTDKHILAETFDTVAGKARQALVGGAVINRVRTKYWDDRVTFARFIGMVALADEFTEEQIAGTFADVEKYVKKDSQLIDALLISKDPKVLRILVTHVSAELGAGRLLNLLSFPDVTVRLVAISMLKDYNQIQLLQLIIEAYKREKDPVVKEAYKENFWFIKQRAESGSI